VYKLTSRSAITDKPRCGVGKLWQKCGKKSEKTVHLTSLYYTAQSIFWVKVTALQRNRRFPIYFRS